MCTLPLNSYLLPFIDRAVELYMCIISYVYMLRSTLQKKHNVFHVIWSSYSTYTKANNLSSQGQVPMFFHLINHNIYVYTSQIWNTFRLWKESSKEEIPTVFLTNQSRKHHVQRKPNEQFSVEFETRNTLLSLLRDPFKHYPTT